jgi:hypothetical protein
VADPIVASLIARAIVHLNFNEADQALNVLLVALTEFNFTHAIKKETANVSSPAAA